MLNWRDPLNPLSGGAERVSLAYLKELVRRGHEVAWFANEFPGCRREELFDGIQIVRGGGMGSSVLKARHWYRCQGHFDLVIDQHHGIPWYAPWWSGTNCVAYIHEVLGPIWNSFYPWPLSTVGQVQERWTHWFYRAVPFWTPSDSTKHVLQQHGVKDVQVFLNGTDAKPLAELEPKPLDSPLRLAVVCRLAPNKRVDHAIRAVNVLVQRGQSVQLTIVGSGEVENPLKQLVRDLGLTQHVQFAGRLDEVAKDDCLRRAHFLVHTSVREGWGLNVIEANAMGTPAIVYPVGGLVDSTLHNETGLVTSQETPEAVANAIQQIAQSPETYARFRVNAWNRAKLLQWEQVLRPACDWLEAQAAGDNLQRR